MCRTYDFVKLFQTIAAILFDASAALNGTGIIVKAVKAPKNLSSPMQFLHDNVPTVCTIAPSVFSRYLSISLAKQKCSFSDDNMKQIGSCSTEIISTKQGIWTQRIIAQ